MTRYLRQLNDLLGYAWWRLAAVAAEAALRCKPVARSAMPYALLLGGGGAAYLLGRLVGELLRAHLF